MERGWFCWTGLQRHSVLRYDLIALEWHKGASERLLIGFRLLGTGSSYRKNWAVENVQLSNVSAILSQNFGLCEDLQGEVRHLVG